MSHILVWNVSNVIQEHFHMSQVSARTLRSRGMCPPRPTQRAIVPSLDTYVHRELNNVHDRHQRVASCKGLLGLHTRDRV